MENLEHDVLMATLRTLDVWARDIVFDEIVMAALIGECVLRNKWDSAEIDSSSRLEKSDFESRGLFRGNALETMGRWKPLRVQRFDGTKGRPVANKLSSAPSCVIS